MKILFLNTSDKSGGAAIAANRLMEALTKEGVEVSLLVKERNDFNNKKTVSCIHGGLGRFYSFIFFLWERLIIYLNNGFSKSALFKVSIANKGIDISNHPLVKEADIIHLHWINQGFLSLRTIRKLIKTGKPIVWTMHDMWPLTSICHYSYACDRFIKNCGHCPFLKSTQEKDLSYRVWKKKLFFNDTHIQLIAVSTWLKSLSKQSSLTKKLSCRVIPNVLDNTVFCPGSDKTGIRSTLKIPMNKYIILMGAAKLNDPIKGMNFLIEALALVPEQIKQNSMLILFGSVKNDTGFLEKLPVPYFHFGLLQNNQQIAQLYQAADVVIVPSLYETFGQTIIEAMACGCPAVSFNNSGQTDIIDHQTNGYLAEYKSAEDLANGIEWVLNHPDKEGLSAACVTKVRTHYAEPVVARQYIELYNSLLKK